MNNKLQAVIEKMPKTGFVFNEQAHVYLLDGKPMTGVTTILSCIAKPALIQWSADEAVKFLGWFNTKYGDNDFAKFTEKWGSLKQLDATEFFKTLTEARVQHAKRKKDAGDIGTRVHNWIERFVRACIDGTKPPPVEKDIKDITDNFVRWAFDNRVKFLETEKRLYSRKHWYAGTVDLVMEIGGKVWIGDIKTSSGIYPEYFFQTAGYQIALQEMGEYPEIEGHIILNCKKDGEFEAQKSFGLETNKSAFLAALTIYRAQQELKVTT